LFGQEDDFDISGFRPKPPARPEQVRDVAEHAGFRSREAVAPVATSAATSREPRRYRTGRNVQLNLKVRREALDAFYRIADAQDWVLGEAFEHAIAALEKSIGEANR
jgi:hypothetical protein